MSDEASDTPEVPTPANEYPGDALAAALARHGIALEAEQIELLDQYARLLWEWNARLNLTRHTDYERFVARDLRDVMALADLLEPGEHVLDLGTGGGVPGIPLAIVRPDVTVSLCESIAKKARAASEIVASLGIEVPVYHQRAEQVVEEHDVDTIVARAVGPLEKILTWVGPHWDRFHRLLLVKGPSWTEERQAARERGLLRGLELRRKASYPLAGTESEGVVLEVRRVEGS
ncbi:MAG: 16S rRNA (guanine(527)-N(7))-methyltransferase RsmG [Pirellulales bacterium]|nr:16S rRNA (guanine(527)-N(7))-methyltransferase RsmG [Pirellulales bacterium]